MDPLNEIVVLIEKEIRNKISKAEKARLDSWVGESEENKAVYDRLTNSKYLIKKLDIYQLFDHEEAHRTIMDRVKYNEKKVISFRSGRLLRYAATILLPFILGAGIIYYMIIQNEKTTMATIDEEIKPGGSQAVLVLSDGKQVKLDQRKTVAPIDQGDVTASTHKNALSYKLKNKGDVNKDQVYNELYTPKGGNYQLFLSDGTKVILNAESRLRYPVNFTDSTRTVFLSGEAFFDVTHAGKPFVVNTEELAVRVLGTTFNVTAYESESSIRTTLVKGKVQIDAPRGKVILNPSDQAIVSGNTEIQVEKVNTKYFTSWIDGKLDFNNMPLELVMQRLSRWYDFEYRFENESIPGYHFTATFDRDQPISEVLEMLSLTTNVNFKREGSNRIIVR